MQCPAYDDVLFKEVLGNYNTSKAGDKDFTFEQNIDRIH
jgi:hypothetical protein